MSGDRWIRWVAKPIVFAAALLPVADLIWGALHGELGANPLEKITHATGDWTLRFIIMTLAITPVRRLTGRNWLIRFRRMIGLFAFFYGSLHFLIYVVADRFAGLDLVDGVWAWSTARALAASIWEDIYKRPYITVGFTGLVAMVPLAITSTAGWIRRLGGRRWNRIHQLIYVTAVAGVIHYWWLVKADILHPAIYASFVVILLGLRLIWALKRSRWLRHPVEARA
jgi:sulfoxide reductase heme-binding subunit YedZ